MNLEFSFFKYTKPIQTVIVLGCGGTGSHTIPNMLRLLLGVDRRIRPDVYLIDGDTVERKNILRQNFIEIDLDSNKAEVLGRRYSTAFGIPVTSIPEFSDNKNNVLARILKNTKSACIIGCVDSPAGRRHIRSTIRRYKKRDIIWIDSGNEEKAGQVVMGYRAIDNTDIIKTEDIPKCKTGIFSLPFVTDVYPEIMKSRDKNRNELSCDDLANVAPQAMMTNVTAANMILNFYNSLIYNQPIANFGVAFSISNGFSSMVNNLDNLSLIPQKELSEHEK